MTCCGESARNRNSKRNLNKQVRYTQLGFKPSIGVNVRAKETCFAKQMTVFKVGEINMPDKTFMLPGTDEHEPITTPVYCYLIEHEQGYVLVDTGIANEGLGAVAQGQSIVEQLTIAGIKRDAIKFIVMTHMHLDHAAYMNAFDNCRFVIRQSEWEMALSPTENEGGYVPSQYDRVRESDVWPIPDNEDFDLFKDGSIVLVSTRGHSIGHQSVLVKLPQSGGHFIAGDAAYLRENLDRNILPGRCTDEVAAYISMSKLREYERRGYAIHFGHDPLQEQSLLLYPQRYL